MVNKILHRCHPSWFNRCYRVAFALLFERAKTRKTTSLYPSTLYKHTTQPPTDMSEDANTASPITAPVHQNSDSNYDPLKSVAVVSLAGFAGSLCGVSLARSRINASPNLPTILAFSTATFAGIVEFSAVVSPTQILVRALKEHFDLDLTVELPENKYFQWDQKCTETLGDYVIGGAFAGAIFQGGQINPSAVKVVKSATEGGDDKKSITHTVMSGNEKQKKARGKGKVVTLASKKIKNKKANSSAMNAAVKKGVKETFKAVDAIPHAAKSRRGIMLGLIPGLTLGFIAGLAQIGIAKASDYFEAMEGDIHHNDESNNDDDNFSLTQEQEDEIEAKVKSMTMEEIQQEIDALKAKLAENKNNRK